MGRMADRASFSQRLMFENKWPRLLAMTLTATFILSRHRKAALWLQDVLAMRIVALDAIHVPFVDRMMLWQAKLSLNLQMAIVASRWILPWVDDEFSAAAASLE